MQLKILIVTPRIKEPYFEVIGNVPSLSKGLKRAPHISWNMVISFHLLNHIVDVFIILV
jgi:hypothetical protein